MKLRRDNHTVTLAAAAFTLVEVILAIGIATGILVVALVFYHQAANLRGQLIAEAERLSAIRLVMDRISADLRAAFEQPQVGFTGSTDSMEFVVARAVEMDATFARVSPASDLRRVFYFLTASLEGTNFVITGLDRTEESLLARPVASSAQSETTVTPLAPLLPATMTGTNEWPAEPLAESIRFVRFRYWDGAGWLEEWDAPGLPRAVEVSLGTEPLPEAELPEAYPYEVFRRILVVPARLPTDDDWWAAL